jgi:hypothetical protein
MPVRLGPRHLLLFPSLTADICLPWDAIALSEWSEWDERHGRSSREVAVERSGSCRDTRRLLFTSYLLPVVLFFSVMPGMLVPRIIRPNLKNFELL